MICSTYSTQCFRHYRALNNKFIIFNSVFNNLFVTGPPKILSNQTQFGSQGDTVNIECAAFAVPRIDNIIWTFDGKEIDSMHDQVRVQYNYSSILQSVTRPEFIYVIPKVFYFEKCWNTIVFFGHYQIVKRKCELTTSGSDW